MFNTNISSISISWYLLFNYKSNMKSKFDKWSNNSTNINKTNNDISPKIIEHRRPQHMKLEIQVPSWDRDKHMAGLNW